MNLNAPRLNFSHVYPKLHGQDRARLLHMLVKDPSSLTPEFVHYDTLYFEKTKLFPCVEKHYVLPTGKVILLVFLGNKLFPFTTVRRYTPEKERYYAKMIGKVFEVVITEEQV